MPSRSRYRVVLLLSCLAVAASLVVADEPVAAPTMDAKTYRQTVNRAVAFLKGKQAADGSFAAYAGPGVTAVAATGLLRIGRAPTTRRGQASSTWRSSSSPTAASTRPENMLPNYETSWHWSVLHEANRDRRYDKLIKNAEQFLKEHPVGRRASGQDRASSLRRRGLRQAASGPTCRTPASSLDALKAAGDGPDDPAVKKALIFVSRCQNLESEDNTTPFAAKNPDGGFYYTPAAGGESEAGKTANGGLRSYGSMTYAGLKSMIYAGVGPDDPRVKAAVEVDARSTTTSTTTRAWAPPACITTTTPFAKALDAASIKEIEDAKGDKHDWRQDLLAQLVRRQQPNGSWVNDENRMAGGRALPGDRLCLAVAGLLPPG